MSDLAAPQISSTSITPFLGRAHIAYFTMEIALRPDIHSYSGGLGILAGDTARSAADLDLPMVFVSLVSRAGYFRQEIDAEGRQVERPDWWEVERWCRPLNAMIAVEIEGKPVWVRPWLYLAHGSDGHQVPVLLLDTDLEANSEENRALTHYLYGGDDAYRLKQEIVLGIGGVRLLHALGFDIRTYHLNEGHAAFLTLELLNRSQVAPEDSAPGEELYDIPEVRARCVFTTHTPVEAGHDRFAYDLVERALPGFIDRTVLQKLAGADNLNMTRLALNLSDYVNGVAERHAETTEKMFPGYRIHAVTNGVHLGTWAHPSFAALYDERFPRWRHEPEVLIRALQLPDEALAACRRAAKADLITLVETMTGKVLSPEIMTIGFARRMTGYKRPLLLFAELDRLLAIADRHPLQLVISGKAHPRDGEGKEAIRRIHELTRTLPDKLRCVFLPNYDMQLAARLVAGVDLWLNTPVPPLEASGTSGMKAALNGVLNCSVLDGWWIEACIEGVTGWSIGDGSPALEHETAADLYRKLEDTILPLYADAAGWGAMMKQSIATIASHFNTHRMMRRYATEAYLR
jgi:glycogen phosphorylase